MDWFVLAFIVLNMIVTVVLVYRIGKNVLKIEIATNSMKDQLVEKTAKASHAEGREEARVEGEEKAANLVIHPKKGK